MHVYGKMEELIYAEMRSPISERIRGVVIVTPNHLHYRDRAANAFIKAGFHVIIDKPLVHTYRQAEVLSRLHKNRPQVKIK